MAAAKSPSLRSRFQGCMVSAVAGDCLGAPYEVHGVPANTFEGLTRFFNKVGTEITDKDYLWYTDDTAMARSVAQSLIDNEGNFSSKDLAKKFAAEYSKQPKRGYGGSVTTVLKSLGEDLDDVFQPAKSQFEGSGSYGNGGAMRVAPVGLCPESDFDKMIEIARQSAQLTHSNPLGYNGAILQACAVHLALHADPATFDADSFIDKLLSVMEREEPRSTGETESDGTSPPLAKASRREEDTTTKQPEVREYCLRLGMMKTLLEEDADIKKIAKELGNDIAAHKSVPAAIYSFLRCQRPVEGIEASSAVERTILFAISLDGDTDTIGSMAGAIAGAYYGLKAVPKDWITVCEGTDLAIQQANRLHDIKFPHIPSR